MPRWRSLPLPDFHVGDGDARYIFWIGQDIEHVAFVDVRGAIVVGSAARTAFGRIEHGTVRECDQDGEIHNAIHLG